MPLAYIAGAVLGLHPSFLVDLEGETLDSHAALKRLGLAPLELEPKEGLALNNGTGASTASSPDVTRSRQFTACAVALATAHVPTPPGPANSSVGGSDSRAVPASALRRPRR